MNFSEFKWKMRESLVALMIIFLGFSQSKAWGIPTLIQDVELKIGAAEVIYYANLSNNSPYSEDVMEVFVGIARGDFTQKMARDYQILQQQTPFLLSDLKMQSHAVQRYRRSNQTYQPPVSPFPVYQAPVAQPLIYQVPGYQPPVSQIPADQVQVPAREVADYPQFVSDNESVTSEDEDILPLLKKDMVAEKFKSYVSHNSFHLPHPTVEKNFLKKVFSHSSSEEMMELEGALFSFGTWSDREKWAAIRKMNKVGVGITHLELFKLLKEFPRTEQFAAHEILNPLVFTRLDFFPESAFAEAFVQIDFQILCYHLLQSNYPLSFERFLYFKDRNVTPLSGWLDVIAYQTYSDQDIEKMLVGLRSLEFEEAKFYLFALWKRGVSPELIKKYERILGAKLPFDNERLDLGSLLDEWMKQSNEDRIRFIRNQLDQKSSLTGSELIQFLREIPSVPVRSKNEKKLLDLRDRLREFTKKEWTAFDLFHMDVPQNVALAIRAVQITQSASVLDIALIQAHLRRIIKFSNMHDIQTNPDKPRMASPAQRGVKVVKIRELGRSELRRLMK